MIYGIGTDIIAISRFQRFLDSGNDAIFNRLFTERERLACESNKRSAARFAARFAAKEAFLKALGTGLRGGLSWVHMEIINNNLGKPVLHLNGKAQEMIKERNVRRIFLSLSHDSDSAVAMVILETP